MLLSDWGFFLKAGTEEDFNTWLEEHEVRFAAVAPSSYEYLGTYVALWRGEGESAQFHQIWRYGSPRPPDLRAAAQASTGDFTEMARQFLSFVDSTRDSDETFRLYRSARKDPEAS